MRAFFIGPLFQLHRRALHVTEAKPFSTRRNTSSAFQRNRDRATGVPALSLEKRFPLALATAIMDVAVLTGPEAWMPSTDDAMEVEPVGGGFRLGLAYWSTRTRKRSIIEAAQRGIIGRCDAGAPGRNERRSAGHGKRRATRCHASKTIQGQRTSTHSNG